MNYPQLTALDQTWDQLCQSFQAANSWEERYRNLLLLGKALPRMPEEFRQDDALVQGCESRSWLAVTQESVWIDSDARIIRGLITIMLALNHAKPASSSSSELLKVLEELHLKSYISETRINGITAIWTRLQSLN